MKRVIILFLTIFLGAGFLSYVHSGQSIKVADELLENECFERAIEEYLKLVYLNVSDKYNANAEYKVGLCLQRNKKYWRAVQQWENVIKKYPATEWAKKAKDGIKAVKIITEDVNRIYDVAGRKYEVNRNPRYPLKLRDKLAEMYIRFGDDFADRAWVSSGYKMELEKYEFETAQYWYEKVISEYPDSFIAPYAIERLGYLYYRSELPGNYSKAVEQYMRMPELFGDRVLWVLRGLRLAADTHRDKLKRKASIEIYERIRDLAAEKIGDDSFYKNYAETQIESVK